ncbi:MAG: AAA family ATPase, partial [Sphingomonadales bacterium]
DMHLGNICLIDGAPVPFDCIEFDDDIACVDVLYDLAFPVMGLVRFGRQREAQLLLNRYLAATRDYGGLALMPLFLTARALVRAMAEGLSGRLETARTYARLADQLRAAPRPRLVALGGLSGTGKSTAAYRLALELAPGPGAVVLRSDEIRKRMFDTVPEDRLGADAYLQSASRTMYSRMGADATTALAAGWPVVVDATFMGPGDRAAIEAVAGAAGVPFTGLWLDAPADVLRARVTGRRNDASDATVAVLDRQLKANVGPVAWNRIDASGDPADVAARAVAVL